MKEKTPPVQGSKSIKPDQDINLLTDTGLAVRQLKKKRQLYQLTFLCTFLTVVIMVGVFSFWLFMDRQKRDIQDQIASLDQRITTYLGVEQLALLYLQRLNGIKTLVSTPIDNQEAWFLLNQMREMAATVNGSLYEYRYGENQLEGKIRVSTLSDANQMLGIVEEKTGEKLWSSVIIDEFSRLEDGAYSIKFVMVIDNTSIPADAG